MHEAARDLWLRQPPRGVLCWNCCHPFDNIPAYLPIAKARREDPLVLTGYFCSWDCVKAYAVGQRKSLSYIGLLAYLTYYKPTHCRHVRECTCLEAARRYVPIAPPKELLQAFGGPMSIEEYRKGFWIIQKKEDIAYNHEIEIRQVKPPCVLTCSKRTKRLM